ncbi:MAG: SdpI family protein [Clostridium sp.]
MKSFIKKNLLGILTFTPLIIGLIALNFLTDTIATHWGMGGEVDRFGSKYEILILPVMTIVILGVYALRSRLGTATENKYAIIITAVILNVVTLLIIATTFKSTISTEFNSSRIVSLFMGVIFIITGNYMPKFRRNGIVAIRTPWTINNDEVWYKTHRIGGKLTLIAGVIMIVISLLFNKLTFVPLLVITLLVLLITTIYSYIVAGNKTYEK